MMDPGHVPQVEDVISETSGDYRRACLAALLTKPEHDAMMLHNAIKGLGKLFGAHPCDFTLR